MSRHGFLVRASSLVVLGALALGAGCGGDDDDSDDGGGTRGEYVDAFIDASDSEDMTAEQNTCLAEAVVDAVGVERLEDAVTPGLIRERKTSNLVDLGMQISEEDGETYYENLEDCVDLRQLLIDTVMGGEAVTEQGRDCLDEKLTDDLLEQLMVNGFVKSHAELEQDSATADQISGAFRDCAASADATSTTGG